MYWWINFNEGSCINSWLPTLCVRRRMFYFSQRIPLLERIHVIWGSGALRKSRGVFLAGYNIMNGNEL